ncbi:hypothetical protein SNOG_02862 [Parastagonospora nodorum SN15]|uniref:Uncharacterized protein n=1 Tax=Phaeosphaeria nodorum (strain SN15 / ATCC MYA-4574 / FGSC 10173) TaxID=321614 RepID=Q0UZF2_PHANO|nr:hypothetical protein SNOG_02862 [Parastagonospora nodorum SN15]EAT89593.1 hypothetical protein SNOG_02862 [Parastagonospora nodorum SN15]
MSSLLQSQANGYCLDPWLPNLLMMRQACRRNGQRCHASSLYSSQHEVTRLQLSRQHGLIRPLLITDWEARVRNARLHRHLPAHVGATVIVTPPLRCDSDLAKSKQGTPSLRTLEIAKKKKKTSLIVPTDISRPAPISLPISPLNPARGFLTTYALVPSAHELTLASQWRSPLEHGVQLTQRRILRSFAGEEISADSRAPQKR